ncbi:MAG: Na+-translocating ferredoxin:NAD+ oxidoreductase RnfG subunit [bacterium]|jgi:Na+-translocating ferredoxin:NAD+ oxidoreductase RnfG subunit
MKKGIFLILLCSVGAAFGVATFSYFPQHVCKKMDKHVRKTFGKESIYYSIATPDSLKLNHEVYKVVENDSIKGFVMVTRALGCQLGGCDKPSSDSIAFEQFFFMTAFDQAKQITQVRILEYTSNHGYEIANKSWLKQFAKEGHFEVGKNIDGISGATISVNSLTNNVNRQRQIITTVE